MIKEKMISQNVVSFEEMKLGEEKERNINNKNNDKTEIWINET